MLMTTISISIDDDLLAWLDQLVTNGVVKNRSEAVRGGIHAYVKDRLGITTRDELRRFLKDRQKRPFQDGVDVIRNIRSEE